MSQTQQVVTVLHADTEAERFYLLKTKENQVLYSHWRAFQQAGFASVRPGQVFSIRTGHDDRDDQTEIVSEVLDAVEAKSDYPDEEGSDDAADHLTAHELRSMLENAEENLVVVRSRNLKDAEFKGLDLPASVVFLGCTFEGSFRLLDSRVHGEVWFLNCDFKQHLSLRGSRLNGNAVLFGCDFSGPGGISFRGMQGRSILIEYGARGSDDMLWLNELSLTGCIALSGAFRAPVQIRAQQDENPINSTEPTIKRIVIGKKATYDHENLSRNQFQGGIECTGYRLQEGLEVHNSEIRELVLTQIDASHIQVNNCYVRRDVAMEQVQPRDEQKGIAITACDIERRLEQTGNSLSGHLNLEGTSVGQTWALELSSPRQGVPHARLRRFHASKAWFEPVDLVYGDAPRWGVLAPPKFGLLEGHNRGRSLTAEERRDLAEAYTACKNWLSESGHLREEDYAFFHMRHAKEHRPIIRLLFGTFFGWGIHLRNIILTAILVIILFAFLYRIVGSGGIIEMLLLSGQSFINSFFGRWPDYSPVGILSILVTLESLLGIILVTTLVGCYIRKLLR